MLSQQTKEVSWWRERFPLNWKSLKDALLGETMPNHMKIWWFALGGIPLFLFATLMVTGILLAFNYVPEPPMAYKSVAKITNEIPFGAWVRGIHKWSAEFMIITLILHAMRVAFTGAFRKPRELTWVFGAILLLLALVEAFLGYSLIYEHLSYWAVVVGTNIAESIPLVGTFAANLLRGGPEIGPETWQRFFALHVAVVPLLIGLVITVHLTLVRAHGVAKIPGADNEESYKFYPDHVLREAIIFIFLLFVFTILTVIFSPHMGSMADPLTTPAHIKPEWYFYWVFRLLKLVPLIVGVMIPVIGAVVFIIWPFIDGKIKQDDSKIDYLPILGSLIALILIVMTIWEAVSF